MNRDKMNIEEATSRVELPASASNAVRVSTFQRVTADGKPVCGVLQLDEARKAGCKVNSRRYAVTELEPGENGRRFKLTKPLAGRKGEEDFEYVVYLPYNRGFDKCVCKAWLRAGKCSHCECLRAHMRQGNVPPVREPKVAPEPPGQYRLLTDRGYMRVSAPTREEAVRLAESDGYTVQPEFPASPTCNPAAVADYWSKVSVPKDSGKRPADFFRPKVWKPARVRPAR